VDEQTRQLEHRLAERMKELDCVYALSNLIETPNITITEILDGAVGLLPPAWQYPSMAGARIILPDHILTTPDFRDSPWRLASDIKVQGVVAGSVEVCYRHEPPSHGQDPFLPEEVRLLDAVAERLGHVIERKQAGSRQDLAVEILGILNDPTSLADSITRILTAIKREIGVDAVGIRLRSGDDFPYSVQNGFSKDFLLAENTLTVKDADGGPCVDEDGRVSLECTCGLVISGKTDPTSPFFTEAGSFWTGNSLPLLDLPAEKDPRLHPRNTCIHQGYLSVALIPIRADREIVGLLQLNDRKKDRFTLGTVRFLEGIAASIGVALWRKQIEEERQALTAELQKSLLEVKKLSGLLPICASCKKIRDDRGYWNQIESYIRDHSEAEFSHSICPECVKRLYPELGDQNQADREP